MTETPQLSGVDETARIQRRRHAAATEAAALRRARMEKTRRQAEPQNLEQDSVTDSRFLQVLRDADGRKSGSHIDRVRSQGLGSSTEVGDVRLQVTTKGVRIQALPARCPDPEGIVRQHAAAYVRAGGDR